MERPYTGKWFEELTPGLVIHHAIRRSITESDNVMFTSMTMNPAWLHLDFDYATNETEFGRPLVNSMLTVAMVIGISVHETTLGTTVANLGFGEVTFPAPVFHGDTLRVETKVTAASGVEEPTHAGNRHVRASGVQPGRCARVSCRSGRLDAPPADVAVGVESDRYITGRG